MKILRRKKKQRLKKSKEIKYKKPVETDDKAVNTEISNYEIDPDKIKEESKSWFGF